MKKLIVVSNIGGLLLGLVFVGAQAQAETRAAMSDYVWEVLPEKALETEFSRLCDELEKENGVDTYQRPYLDCWQKAAENHDNALSRQWGLSETLAREKDTIYIKVPNRRLPLTFRESYVPWASNNNNRLHLKKYDAKAQHIIIGRTFWDNKDNVLVDLNTGVHQSFIGTELTLSPNDNYGVTALDYADVYLWQKQSDGYYLPAEEHEDNVSRRERHLAYYNVDPYDSTVAHTKFEWVNNNSVLVDYYFKINPKDTAAYRVRFNYVKPKGSDEWQLIPIR